MGQGRNGIQGMHENVIASFVVDLALRLHRRYGAGVYENVYETILEHEFRKKGWGCRRQLLLPIQHDELMVPNAYKLDMLVEDKVILEIKSIEKLERVHFKQLTTYLRLTGKRLGLLLNFGEERLVVRRVVNGLDDLDPNQLDETRKQSHV